MYVLRQPQRSWMSREAWVAGLSVSARARGTMVRQSDRAGGGRGGRTDLSVLPGHDPGAGQGHSGLAQPPRDRLDHGDRPCRRLRPVPAAVGVPAGAGPCVAKPAAIALAVLALSRIWTWWRYLAALENGGAPTRTLEIFTACRMWIFAAGLVLPLALVVVGLDPARRRSGPVRACRAFGASPPAGRSKFILITRAAYNQGFALPHTPIRGLRRAGTGGQAGMDLAMREAIPTGKARRSAPQFKKLDREA